MVRRKSASPATNKQIRVNITKLKNYVDAANSEIGSFRRTFTLSPDKIINGASAFQSLTWDSVAYGTPELNKVPNQRGIYAFAIRHESSVLPPHGYILYIGIAGRRSKRSLRARFEDYLDENKVIARSNIAYMIGTWSKVLRFFFATVDDNVTSVELETLEKQLNGALMPPFSIGDLEADVKRKQRAFR